MSFNETKTVLNDLLWQFNGNREDNGICRITEAMGHCFNVEFNNQNQMNINPSEFNTKGELAKFVLNAIY